MLHTSPIAVAVAENDASTLQQTQHEHEVYAMQQNALPSNKQAVQNNKQQEQRRISKFVSPCVGAIGGVPMERTIREVPP
jgi:hypothetical protein